MRLNIFLFAAFIPVSAFAADAQTSAYVDPQFGFTLHYPQMAIVDKRDVSPSMVTTFDVSFTLMSPAAMFEPSTNLQEAAVFIGVSTNPAVVSACAAAAPSSGEKPNGTAMIGGAQFTRLKLFDGAAGSLGESTIYRAVHAGACYELVEFLFYHDIGAYAPGTVQPFDEAKITSMLDAVTQSFAFAR